MKLYKYGILCSSLMVASYVGAEINGIDIVNDAKYTCIACHSLNNKVVGPSYKDIAKHYSNDLTKAEDLAASIKNGSVNTFGPVPMPQNAVINQEEAKAAANYILSIK